MQRRQIARYAAYDQLWRHGGDRGRTSKALICGLRLWPAGVETQHGKPQLRFSETLRTNTSLLRRLVNRPVDRRPHHRAAQPTSVSIVYLKGVTSEELVKEVRERLNRIDTDQVLESGILEEFIEDAPWSPFPTVLRTERPDRVAACLFEGRVAILVDGTPFVLIVPCTLTEFLVGSDDYYERAFLANYLRSVRAFVFFHWPSRPSTSPSPPFTRRCCQRL